jgi:virginiamycin B lyase
MFNHFKIIIILCVIIYGIGISSTSLLQNTTLGYDTETRIDRDHVYFKNMDFQSMAIAISSHGEYEYTLVSIPSMSDDQESPNSNTIIADSYNQSITLTEYPVPEGSRPHDVAPATSMSFVNSNVSKNLFKDIVWYTAQSSGELGKLNTTTGETLHIFLGEGSAPHGVIAGPDGAPWITEEV